MIRRLDTPAPAPVRSLGLIAVTVVIAAFWSLVGLGVHHAVAAPPLRVVAVGDSIGAQVFPHLTGNDIHYDAEPSRSPYDTGADDRATTVQALAVLSRTVPTSSSSWVIVQEGATGTKDGRYIDNAEWTRFIHDVLRLSAGRCLVFVYPGYASGTAGSSIAYARTIIARDIFAAYSHRCIYTVNWWAAANSNPSYLSADGLHPSPAGVAWLAGQINAIVPDA